MNGSIPSTLLGRSAWSLQRRDSIMAVGFGTRQAEDEEARAEVDVLKSKLDKIKTLNLKLEGSLRRLETSGKSVQEAVGPLAGNTQRLQVLGTNIDGIIRAIDRIRQPSDIKNNEEDVIRRGPGGKSFSPFLSSLKRVNKALNELKQTNLRSNQQAVADLTRLLKQGHNALEAHYRELLQEDSQPIEPLHFITKEKSFPPILSDRIDRLALINEYMVTNARQNGSFGASPMIQAYADVRGPYLTSTLANLASASVNTAKKKSPESIYRPGTNAIGMYAKGIQGAFLAEHQNIRRLFLRDDQSQVFNLTTQRAVAELAQTLQGLDRHIKANLTTDCFLAYEIWEIITDMSNIIDEETRELKNSFTAALKPIRETSKSSFAELQNDVRRTIDGLSVLPANGAAIPIVTETMARLQNMVNFLRPIAGFMISIGDGGWRMTCTANVSSDQIPTLNTFDIGSDGAQFWVNFCMDTITQLLETLDRKSQMLNKNRSVHGVFILNSYVIIDRMVRTSELDPKLRPRMHELERFRKNAMKDYSGPWSELSRSIMDVTFKAGTDKRTSGGAPLPAESAAILKGMSSKEKDERKKIFLSFNSTFDELVARHKSLSMEREVKQMLARDVQDMIEKLYIRWFDRYHELDKARGKYVKYDKNAMSAVFLSLGS